MAIPKTDAKLYVNTLYGTVQINGVVELTADDFMNFNLWRGFPKKTELERLSDKISKVVFNEPATIILWKDGTKTVVKIQNDEVYDREKGFLMCIAKKLGNDKGNYNNIIKRWCE